MADKKQKNHLLEMEKGDVGMAKRFSKNYGNKDELSTTCNPKVMSRCLLRCLSEPDATSLHHCLKNKQLKSIWFLW